MDFGFESGCPGLENSGFCKGAKIHFRRSWNSHDSIVHFCMILDGLGIHFHVDLGVFGIQTCRLACLVASLRRRGAILEHWGAQERTL